MIKEIQSLLARGIISAQRAVEYQRVRTYWLIGQKITRAVGGSQNGLMLNSALYSRVSRDITAATGLNLSRDVIQRAVRFYAVYPKFPHKTPLTFTHYIALTRVTDEKQRARLEKEAVTKEISSYALKEKINRINLPDVKLLSKAAGELTVERGEPYIYYVRQFTDLEGVPRPCVDLGFKIHVPLDSSQVRTRITTIRPDKGRYVRSYKKGGIYELRGAPRQFKKTHTYPARVYNVVDGDTLDALIDVGFSARARARFRLKGINAEEQSAAAGRRAKAFLTRYLSKNPYIVVRTTKAGKYGRWLGDVFTLKGESDPARIAAEGQYLNQVMLDKGFASVYK